MNPYDSLEQKFGYKDEEETDTEITDRKPEKKRASSQSLPVSSPTKRVRFDDKPPSERVITTFEEHRLEARRRSNRESAQRCRLREQQKIQELEAGNERLQDTNKALTRQLEEALQQTHRLQLMAQKQHQLATERNQALKYVLASKHQHCVQEQSLAYALNRPSASPLAKELENVPRMAPYKYDSLHQSHPTLHQGYQQAHEATRTTACGTSNQAIEREGIESKASYAALPSSLSPPPESPHYSTHPSWTNGAYALTAEAAEERVSVAIKLSTLRQELKNLKELEKKIQS